MAPPGEDLVQHMVLIGHPRPGQQGALDVLESADVSPVRHPLQTWSKLPASFTALVPQPSEWLAFLRHVSGDSD